jgi:hypothetical protein
MNATNSTVKGGFILAIYSIPVSTRWSADCEKFFVVTLINSIFKNFRYEILIFDRFLPHLSNSLFTNRPIILYT